MVFRVTVFLLLMFSGSSHASLGAFQPHIVSSTDDAV